MYFACGVARQDAVDKDFCSGEIDSFGADDFGVIDLITTNSELDMACISFFGSIGTDNRDVCGFASLWQFGDWDEKHGVGAHLHCAVYPMAMSQASNFGRACFNPMYPITHRFCRG